MRFAVRLLLFALLAILSSRHFLSAAENKSSWQSEWEQTVRAANKEGELTIYVYRYGAAFEAFRSEYPQIKVNVVSATASQLGTRIMAERRGGKFLADLFSSGAYTDFNVLYKAKAVDPIKPLLLLPEVTDETKWLGAKHRSIDPEARFIFAYLGNSGGSGQLSYHTRQVDPKDFSSFWDLVQPKWKGKIVSLEPANTGLGASMQFFYYNSELGPQWIKRFFGSMEITFSREFRQMTDWLAQGRFALRMGCKDVDRARQHGLPVASFG